MTDRSLWEKLTEVWELLNDDDRYEVIDHARWLAFESRLVGGPLDGLPIPERFKNGDSVTIEIDGKAAIYIRSNGVALSFNGFSRIGGEGGEWPDIKADELRVIKGGLR